MDPYTMSIIESWLTLLFTILGIILTVMIILRIAVYLRAFSKRFSFMYRLKKVCRKESIEIHTLSSPYRSILKPSKTSEILLKKGSNQFTIKFFPCLINKDTYLFDQEGNYHTLSNFNPIYLNLRYYTTGVNLDKTSSVLLPFTLQYQNDIFKKSHKTNFTEKDLTSAIPLLCINPIAHEIQKADGSRRVMVFDGDELCGYTVYSAAGLLKMLAAL